MEEKFKNSETHCITIEEREKLTITGVTDMESFDEDSVIIYTTLGTLTLKGEDFKINKLSTDSGVIEIDGYVDSVIYSSEESSGKSKGLFSRIFR